MQTISPNIYISNNLLKLQEKPVRPIEDLINTHLKSDPPTPDKALQEPKTPKFDWGKRLKQQPPKKTPIKK